MTNHSENRLKQRFVLLLVILVSIGFLWMIRNFLVPLILAAIFAGLLYPFYLRMEHWLGGRRAPASLLTLGISGLVLGLPLVGLMAMVVNEALNLGRELQPVIKDIINRDKALSEYLPGWIPLEQKLQPYKEEILNKAASAADSLGGWLLSSISTVTQDTFGFLLSLFVMLYAMYFFFTNGPRLLRSMKELMPLSSEDRDKVLDRGLIVTLASLKGILYVGALQGVLVGLAFWVCGLYGPAFWGTMVLVLSAIPGLGAPLIWLPAAIYLMITNKVGLGIGLALWGMLVVGLVDNLLRPVIVSRDAKLPDVVILVSILGGIATFGAVGIIIGPILAAIMDTAMKIYRRTFAGELSS